MRPVADYDPSAPGSWRLTARIFELSPAEDFFIQRTRKGVVLLSALADYWELGGGK